MDAKNKEMESMSEELVQKETSLNSTTTELQQLKDMNSHQKKRIAEMLSNLLKELGEIGNFCLNFLVALLIICLQRYCSW